MALCDLPRVAECFIVPLVTRRHNHKLIQISEKQQSCCDKRILKGKQDDVTFICLQIMSFSTRGKKTGTTEYFIHVKVLSGWGGGGCAFLQLAPEQPQLQSFYYMSTAHVDPEELPGESRFVLEMSCVAA